MTGPDHRHTPAEERAIREAALDETIEGTFPASDPPSSIPNPDDDDAATSKGEEHSRGIERSPSSTRRPAASKGTE